MLYKVYDLFYFKMNPFNQLKQSCLNCSKCPDLCRSRTQVVFGSGNPHAKIILIGEAPGAEEDKQGVPFCGASGKILDELLETAGLSRGDLFITNTILCRPEKNRNPAKEEIANCHERLDQLIEIMQPKVIITIGNFATERMIKKRGITFLHGKLFSYHQCKVVPVIHPANYLYSGRNPELFQLMKNDFQTITLLSKQVKNQKSLTDF